MRLWCKPSCARCKMRRAPKGNKAASTALLLTPLRANISAKILSWLGLIAWSKRNASNFALTQTFRRRIRHNAHNPSGQQRRPLWRFDTASFISVLIKPFVQYVGLLLPRKLIFCSLVGTALHRAYHRAIRGECMRPGPSLCTISLAASHESRGRASGHLCRQTAHRSVANRWNRLHVGPGSTPSSSASPPGVHLSAITETPCKTNAVGCWTRCLCCHIRNRGATNWRAFPFASSHTQGEIVVPEPRKGLPRLNVNSRL